MGSVFDRDILYGGLRMDQEFQFGEGYENRAEFILYDAKVLGVVGTDIGDAAKTGLIVSKLETPTEAFVVGTLSGPIAQKFATVDNLRTDPKMPAVVAVFETPSKTEGYSDATVLQFVRVWDGDKPKDKDLPPLEVVNEVPF